MADAYATILHAHVTATKGKQSSVSMAMDYPSVGAPRGALREWRSPNSSVVACEFRDALDVLSADPVRDRLGLSLDSEVPVQLEVWGSGQCEFKDAGLMNKETVGRELPRLLQQYANYWSGGVYVSEGVLVAILHEPGPRPPGPPYIAGPGHHRKANVALMHPDDFLVLQRQGVTSGPYQAQLQLDGMVRDAMHELTLNVSEAQISVTFDTSLRKILRELQLYDCGYRLEESGLLVKMVCSSEPVNYPFIRAVLRADEEQEEEEDTAEQLMSMGGTAGPSPAAKRPREDGEGAMPGVQSNGHAPSGQLPGGVKVESGANGGEAGGAAKPHGQEARVDLAALKLAVTAQLAKAGARQPSGSSLRSKSGAPAAGRGSLKPPVHMLQEQRGSGKAGSGSQEDKLGPALPALPLDQPPLHLDGSSSRLIPIPAKRARGVSAETRASREKLTAAGFFQEGAADTSAWQGLPALALPDVACHSLHHVMVALCNVLRGLGHARLGLLLWDQYHEVFKCSTEGRESLMSYYLELKDAWEAQDKEWVWQVLCDRFHLPLPPLSTSPAHVAPAPATQPAQGADAASEEPAGSAQQAAEPAGLAAGEEMDVQVGVDTGATLEAGLQPDSGAGAVPDPPSADME